MGTALHDHTQTKTLTSAHPQAIQLIEINHLIVYPPYMIGRLWLLLRFDEEIRRGFYNRRLNVACVPQLTDAVSNKEKALADFVDTAEEDSPEIAASYLKLRKGD